MDYFRTGTGNIQNKPGYLRVSKSKNMYTHTRDRVCQGVQRPAEELPVAKAEKYWQTSIIVVLCCASFLIEIEVKSFRLFNTSPIYHKIYIQRSEEHRDLSQAALL